HQRGNQLLVSWQDGLEAGQLVQISFLATATGKLSEFFHLEDAPDFRDEFYLNDLSAHAIFLSWMDGEVSPETPTVTELSTDGIIGVFPNPVATTTRIGVNVATAQMGALRVVDAAGRLVYASEVALVSGEQWLTLEARDWPAGTYAFSLQTQEGLLREKLVKQGNPTK
ncbi:MAG: T9SS type A sorting domain-containing protein, partial [Bacteroidota bacterium]